MKLNFIFILFFSDLLFPQNDISTLQPKADPHLRETILEGFRNLSWEASAEQVRLAEKSEFMQTATGWGLSTISYKGEFAGLPARIDYSFKEEKLIEGSYSVKLQNNHDFHKYLEQLKYFLSSEYSSPDYKVAENYETDSIWIMVSPYGLFKGPQYFWEFSNGFICLHSSKFIEEITITVLYVFNIKIDEYYDERLIPLN